MKEVFSLSAIIAVGFTFWSMPGGEPGPTTKGGIADRNAASDVVRCAKQYDDKAMWSQCLDIVTEGTARKAENVARHVNRMVGQTVFAVEE